MSRLLNVAIGYAAKQLPVAEIQAIFGIAGWARYAPNCWLVNTDQTPHYISEEIRKRVSPDDSIFVCEVNATNISGYLHKEIWGWLGR